MMLADFLGWLALMLLLLGTCWLLSRERHERRYDRLERRLGDYTVRRYPLRRPRPYDWQVDGE